MAAKVARHKVFISYYHEDDQEYKDRLVQALESKFVDKSVSQGDIHDEGLPLDEIRRIIRDEHIADATVAIVLIGCCTWQRKHVDWEISASIIDRRNNDRCGLLGILLPTHPDHGKGPQGRNRRRIPQRLAKNIGGKNPFAVVYDWPKNGLSKKMLPKIHAAFLRRKKPPWPDDSLGLFADNRTGDCRRGWQN